MTERQRIGGVVTAKADLAEALRLTMRGTAASVGAITVTMPDGTWRGATINSMTSVSLSPPSILVSLDSAAQVHAAVLESRRFAVNLFAHHQAEMAAIFSDPTRHEERFATGPWEDRTHGVPVLGDALATLVCSVAATLPYATHTITVGQVEAIIGGGADRKPLVYHDGRYGRWTDLK